MPNLSDDVMVYGSYTTAVKAGGVNAGDNPTTYDPEKAGVLAVSYTHLTLPTICSV